MATHNHQLNFVMNLKTGGVGGEMDKLRRSIVRLRRDLRQLNQAGGTPGKNPSPADNEEGKGGILSQIFMPKLLRRIPKDLQKLTNKLGKTGAVVSGLTLYVRAVGRSWYEWYQMILDTRKEMGLTLPEAQSFGAEVLSMTGRFGIAMDRVSNIARFVGQGTDVARNGVVKLSADLALTGAASKTAEADMAKFGFFLHRTLEMAEDQASAASDAIMGVARQAHIPLKTLQTDLMSGTKAIFQAKQEVGGPKALAAFAALAAGMREAGATSDQITAALQSMGDKGSKLFQLFAGSKYQMEPFRNHLARINEGIKSGAIAAASLGDVYEKLGPITLSKLSQSAQNTEKDMQEFFRIFEMSPEQREAWKKSFLTPMERIKMAFTQFWADQTIAVNEFIGKPLNSLMEGMASLAETAVKNYRISTKWLGEKIYEATVFWEDKLKDVLAVVQNVQTTLKDVNSFMSDITGKTEALNRAAENRVPLLSPIARNKKIQEGWTNVQANMWYREQLRQRAMQHGPQSLSPQEHAIVFGPQAQPPTSEAPGASRDPSVELLKEQLRTQQKTNVLMEELMKRQDLDRVRGASGGGANRGGQAVNPFVDAQRS